MKDYVIISANDRFLLVSSRTWQEIQDAQSSKGLLAMYQFNGRVPGVRYGELTPGPGGQFLPSEETSVYVRAAATRGATGTDVWVDTGLELNEPTPVADAFYAAGLTKPPRATANLVVEYFHQVSGMAIEFYWRLVEPVKTNVQRYLVTNMALFIENSEVNALEIFKGHLMTHYGPQFDQAGVKIAGIELFEVDLVPK